MVADPLRDAHHGAPTRAREHLELVHEGSDLGQGRQKVGGRGLRLLHVHGHAHPELVVTLEAPQDQLATPAALQNVPSQLGDHRPHECEVARSESQRFRDGPAPLAHRSDVSPVRQRYSEDGVHAQRLTLGARRDMPSRSYPPSARPSPVGNSASIWPTSPPWRTWLAPSAPRWTCAKSATAAPC